MRRAVAFAVLSLPVLAIASETAWSKDPPPPATSATSAAPAPAPPPSSSSSSSSAGTPAPAAPATTPDPNKIVKYRQTVMGAAGKDMKLLSMIAKGEVDRTADAAYQADDLNHLAITLQELFPTGTSPDKVKTDAKAELWTNNADFQVKAKAFVDATAALSAAVKSGDKAAILAQMGKVGDSCGACHDAYRVEDK